MRYIISLTILLSIIALPAHSELTPTDLDKIREIVKETVSESEKRTKESDLPPVFLSMIVHKVF